MILPNLFTKIAKHQLRAATTLELTTGKGVATSCSIVWSLRTKGEQEPDTQTIAFNAHSATVVMP